MYEWLIKRQKELITILVRISFGILWLQGASWKELPRFGLDTHDNLYYWVSRAIEYPVWFPYTKFTEYVVLPHFLFFAWAIFFSEIAIGLALVFGVRVRWFALYSLLMTVNISLTVINTPGEWFWSYPLMAMVALMMFTYPMENSVFSLEYWLRRKFLKALP